MLVERNIRELENVIHLALLVVTGQEIGVEHLRLAGTAPGNLQFHSAIRARRSKELVLRSTICFAQRAAKYSADWSG